MQVSGLTSGVTSISVGDVSACAVTAAGGVVCWGSNFYGELGNNSTTNSPVPVPVSGLTSGVTQVSVGERSACALKTDGGVLCWGDNSYLQLGNGTYVNANNRTVLAPVPVVGLAGTVTSISVGTNSVCAVLTGGAVQCWGDGKYGALGIGPVSSVDSASTMPVSLEGLASGVTRVAVGAYSACAILAGGSLQCWGSGNNGQLGNGSQMDSSSPAAVMGLPSAVVAVATSATFSCAVTDAGAVLCWGRNSDGQLGNPVQPNSLLPVPVTGLP